MFNHNMIHCFMGQKHPYQRFGQFSFLLLIPKQTVGRAVPELIPHLPDQPWQPLLNNQSSMSPDISQSVTYLAARPQNGEHSEEILMKYFVKLLSNFMLLYKQLPVGVILYTWLAPCPTCVDAICTAFQLPANIAFYVVYSTGEKFPGTDLEYMKSKHHQKGLITIKEECHCNEAQKLQLLLNNLHTNSLNAFNRYQMPPQVHWGYYCHWASIYQQRRTAAGIWKSFEFYFLFFYFLNIIQQCC